jgi:hypothetical protein
VRFDHSEGLVHTARDFGEQVGRMASVRVHTAGGARRASVLHCSAKLLTFETEMARQFGDSGSSSTSIPVHHTHVNRESRLSGLSHGRRSAANPNPTKVDFAGCVPQRVGAVSD